MAADSLTACYVHSKRLLPSASKPSNVRSILQGVSRTLRHCKGIEVVVAKSYTPTTTTTSLVLPKELPSVEEALKILVAAMKALETPDLSKTEVLRLRSIIQAAGVYQVKVAE